MSLPTPSHNGFSSAKTEPGFDFGARNFQQLRRGVIDQADELVLKSTTRENAFFIGLGG